MLRFGYLLLQILTLKRKLPLYFVKALICIMVLTTAPTQTKSLDPLLITRKFWGGNQRFCVVKTRILVKISCKSVIPCIRTSQVHHLFTSIQRVAEQPTHYNTAFNPFFGPYAMRNTSWLEDISNLRNNCSKLPITTDRRRWEHERSEYDQPPH